MNHRLGGNVDRFVTSPRAWLGTCGLALLTAISTAATTAIPADAAPAPRTHPDKCPDAFSCGALAASLAGNAPRDFAGAVRASKRQCAFDREWGCEELASMLVFVGPEHGDPQRGLTMLDARCKGGSTDACSKLARIYERPSKWSGLSPQPDKAAKLREEGCNRGDALDCSLLGDLYEKGGGSLARDLVKARAFQERGCAGTDHYAAGVCGSLGDKIMKGTYGKASMREAYPYLEKSCARGYRCDLAFKIAYEGSVTEGIAPDHTKARAFAKKSCDLYKSCENLAKLDASQPSSQPQLRLGARSPARP